MDFDQRISILKNKLRDIKLDGFIVTNPTNIFYLTGFKGVSPTERESILIFGPKPTLITAKIYQAEATKIKSHYFKIEIVNERNQILASAQKLLKNAKRVGFEKTNLTYGEYYQFKKELTKIQFVPFENLIEDLRIIKSNNEIKKIEIAQVISQKAFSQLIKTIKIGQTEVEIAEKLLKIIKSLGADDLAFESIVASGRNSSLPHYLTGKQKIKRGQILLLDFGAKYKDYCADLTRTIFIGRVKNPQRNIFHHVLTAQKTAIEKISHGQKASEAYHTANNLFKKQKLHQYFLHGLGHGIGIETHEMPYLKPASPRGEPTIDNFLQDNMVFSIEPGLYFPWGGVRIEDLVTVKNGHAKVLGKTIDGIIEV